LLFPDYDIGSREQVDKFIQDLRTTEVRELVIHSMQTAVACDIIGLGLAYQPREERGEWFGLSKKDAERKGVPYDPDAEIPSAVFPIPDGRKKRQGLGSFYTDFSIGFFELLTSINPFSKAYTINRSFVPDFKSGCVTSYRTWINTKTSTNNPDCYAQCVSVKNRAAGEDMGLAIPIAVALGWYYALVKPEIEERMRLTMDIAEAFQFSQPTMMTIWALSDMLNTLSEVGYFCREDLIIYRDFYSTNTDTEMRRCLGELIIHCFDKEFLETFSTDWLKQFKLTYSQQVIVEAFFYLIRISSQFKNLPFTTVPKECLNEVYGTFKRPNHLGFLFGTLVTLSEQYGNDGQYKLVIPDSLVKNNGYCARIQENVEKVALCVK